MTKSAQLWKIVCPLAIGWLFLAAPAYGDTLNFSFSFTGVAVYFGDPSSFDGTVTGVIEGLPDDGTGPASNVIIESVPFPAGFLPATPFDVTSWLNQSDNSFTTLDGQIISANYQASTNYDPNGSPPGSTSFTLDSSGPLARIDHQYPEISETDVTSTEQINFTQTSVPEPSEVAAAGLLGIGLLRRRSRPAISCDSI